MPLCACAPRHNDTVHVLTSNSKLITYIKHDTVNSTVQVDDFYTITERLKTRKCLLNYDCVVNPSTIVTKFTDPIWFACLEGVASTVMHKLYSVATHKDY